MYLCGCFSAHRQTGAQHCRHAQWRGHKQYIFFAYPHVLFANENTSENFCNFL
jgi:hypothetical protein